MNQNWQRLRKDASFAVGQISRLITELSIPATDSLEPDLDSNLKRIQADFGLAGDLALRSFLLGGHPSLRAAVVYLDGMVDQRVVDQDVLSALQRGQPGSQGGLALEGAASPLLSLAAGQVTVTTSWSQATPAILSGKVALFLDGQAQAWLIDAKGFPTRSPEAPTTERNVFGPKESFTENLRTNTSMIRRRIKTTALQLVELRIGASSPTTVTVAYVQHVANPALVTAVISRLHAIRTGTVFSSNSIAAYLRDTHWTPFPLAEMTERPDMVAMELWDGRIAILVDNDPFALLVPATFWDFLQAADDYYINQFGAALMRSTRLLAFLIGISVPGLYTALVMIHLDLLPFDLALTIAGSREAVPFPAPLEYALLIVMFEIMREVSIRIPKAMGTTIGVVGGIVLGQAVVQAGIVSAPLIVAVALVALSLFTMPHFQMSVSARFLAISSLLLGSLLGLYGLFLGALALIIHLTSLTSFDVPYLAPVSPWSRGAWKDVIIRWPLNMLKQRPYQYQSVEPRKKVAYDTPVRHPWMERARR